MKRLFLLLPAAMLFGAGCFLYPPQPTIRTVPVVPLAPPPAPPGIQQPPLEQATTTMATSTTYTDPVYGIRVTYPSSATFETSGISIENTYSLQGVATPLFSIADGSHPLIVSVWSARDAQRDCYATSTQDGPLTETTMINGVAFKVGHWGEAGAGGLWEGPIYRTFRDGHCFDVEYTIETHSDGSPEYEKMRADAQRTIPEYFWPIISSLTFTK